LNEKQLIRRLKRRDEAAFNTLVRLHQGRIFNLCFRMLGDEAEAEDLAQEVFVKAFGAITSFRGESQVGTWLYRIAINLSKNRLKYLGRRHHKRSAALEDVAEGALSRNAPGTTLGEAVPGPEQALRGSRAEKRIQTALRSLDSEFRQLLVLRDIEGLSYGEIMQVTGLAEGTVKSRLHRARGALRAAYSALEGGTSS
jgi:RNA polymerase sigma-70 factor, ECF subfamily